MSSTQIPVIDLRQFSLTGTALKQLSQEVITAAEDFGFFQVINHGIDTSLVCEVYQQMQSFFGQDIRYKARLSNRLNPHMRGYVGLREETPEDSNVGDNKEGFDISTEIPVDHPLYRPDKALYGPNVWPANQPDFSATMMRYHCLMTDLAKRILSLFAIGLNVEADHFEQYLTNPLAQLRLLRYPPARRGRPPQMGCGAHTDYGALTLLSQSLPGLEVQTQAGEWLEVECIDGAFIVNIGDLMARWTNDRLFATLHRVINRNQADRYSAAFFLDPDYDANIECLSTCCAADGTAHYPPIQFGQYNEEKLDATFVFRKSTQAV